MKKTADRLKKKLWKQMAEEGGLFVMLKIETGTEVHFGVYSQTSHFPGEPCFIHIQVGTAGNDGENGFDIERSKITVLSPLEATKILNLSVGTIGKAKNPKSRYGIQRGMLDPKWWKEKFRQSQ